MAPISKSKSRGKRAKTATESSPLLPAASKDANNAASVAPRRSVRLLQGAKAPNPNLSVTPGPGSTASRDGAVGKRKGRPSKGKERAGAGGKNRCKKGQAADQETLEDNEQHMTAEMRERSYWHLLPDNILLCISDSLLSGDVTEYMRFRAVCSGWRRSTAAPSNTERRFRPHNWVLITSGQHDNFSRRRAKGPCCFFNVSNGNYLRVDIPQFRQGYTPISVVDGLLVLLKRSTRELCLLNPFSLSLTELPKADSLLFIVTFQKKGDILHILRSVDFLTSTVVGFCFSVIEKVVFASIKGAKWIDLDDRVSCYSMVSFRGHLYAAAWMTGAEMLQVMRFEREEVQSEPGMEPKKILLEAFRYPSYLGLLEFEGQLLLLLKYYSSEMHPPVDRFEVYKVDVENSMLVPTTIPRDRTFFASEGQCLSVSTSVSPSLIPQCIYYYDPSAACFTVYHSHRPNLEPAHFYYPHPENIYRYNGPHRLPGPYSLASHLICQCANFKMPIDSLLAQQP